jgi:hypothetical protein
LNFQNAPLMRFVITISYAVKCKYIAETTFFEEISTRFLRGPRPFLMVHWLNS